MRGSGLLGVCAAGLLGYMSGAVCKRLGAPSPVAGHALAWDQEQKNRFLDSAFKEMHATCRALRERMYSLVNYSVTLFLVVAAFFLTKADGVVPWVKWTAAFGVLLICVMSTLLLRQFMSTLHAQQKIIASLELAMGFHSDGYYTPKAEPLLKDHPLAYLVSARYYRHTLILYFLVIVGTALFALASIVVTTRLEMPAMLSACGKHVGYDEALLPLEHKGPARPGAEV